MASVREHRVVIVLFCYCFVIISGGGSLTTSESLESTTPIPTDDDSADAGSTASGVTSHDVASTPGDTISLSQDRYNKANQDLVDFSTESPHHRETTVDYLSTAARPDGVDLAVNDANGSDPDAPTLDAASSIKSMKTKTRLHIGKYYLYMSLCPV